VPHGCETRRRPDAQTQTPSTQHPATTPHTTPHHTPPGTHGLATHHRDISGAKGQPGSPAAVGRRPCFEQLRGHGGQGAKYIGQRSTHGPRGELDWAGCGPEGPTWPLCLGRWALYSVAGGPGRAAPAAGGRGPRPRVFSARRSGLQRARQLQVYGPVWGVTSIFQTGPAFHMLHARSFSKRAERSEVHLSTYEIPAAPYL
jgi:hypothetical protein